ncbi:MAG: methionine--tRNA ligase [Synergistaceae bacterium]|nr:methionine--tRNA ligase [Synergistaceae bacterium]
MSCDRTFYVTTPIYYVNDVPHIGHAYTTIAADTLALHHRMAGEKVLFCTGTDEHGQKIQSTAQAKGMTAQELADRTVENFRRLWEVLHITHDDFIRTTEPRHEKVVQTIFTRLMEKGDIYKGTYEGLYCVPCETYVPESQMGEGKTCPDCKRPLQPMTEESYFFRISRYQEPLLRYYEENPDAIQPRSRYNEVVSFIRSGLNDQSVSRTTLKWGIPVPGDERHVVYVWFDALINYLTVAGYPDDEERLRTFWPAVRHLVGKDIIRFHCVVWPAMLLALGLNPPRQVFAHGWWTVEGEKMSKSKGNVVDPFEMVDLYGVDAFRYFLLREVAFGNDGDFSELALVQRVNSDLANDLGNLLNRTLQMVERFQGGQVLPGGAADPLDEELLDAAEVTRKAYSDAMERMAFDEALKALWALIGRGNKYIDATMPWKLGKEGQTERLASVLSVLCTVLRQAALLVSPVMPATARTMWRQLGLAGTPEDAGFAAAEKPFPAGVTVAKGEVLFPRIDVESWKEAKAARERDRNLDPDPGEHEEEIAIDDFRKVELRVGRIVAAEAVPKADKLFKIDVDLGYERRTIVSGIREYYKAEELVGKTIIVVCNLKPVKLRGVESRGMLLAAESCRDDSLALLTLDGAMALGSRIH